MPENITVKRLKDLSDRVQYIEAGQKSSMSTGATFPTSPASLDMHKKDGVVYIYIDGSWVRLASSSEGAEALSGTPSWTSHAYTPEGHAVSWTYPQMSEVSKFVIWQAISPEAEIEDFVFVAEYTGATTAVTFPYASPDSGSYFGIMAIGNEGQESAIGWSDIWNTVPGIPNPRAELTRDGYLVFWNEAIAQQDSVATGATITTGTEAGDYTDTAALDATLHAVTNAAGETDFYYEFLLPAGYNPNGIDWQGYANDASTWDVYAWGWYNESWDSIGTITGDTPTTVGLETFTITKVHMGHTDSDTGSVWVRFQSSDGISISTDQILVNYVSIIPTNSVAKVYEVQSAADAGGTDAKLVWYGDSIVSPEIRSTHTWFRVRGIGWDSSAGDWSEWVSDDNAPPAPTIAITSGVDTVTISIAPADTSHTSLGFSHYVIQRATDGSGTGSTTIDTDAEFAAFPYVTTQPSSTMYYRLIPYDLAGNQGTATAWTEGTVATVTSEASVQDKFDTYGGDEVSDLERLFWLKVSSMDSTEGWDFGVSTAQFSTTQVVEGSHSVYTGDIELGTQEVVFFDWVVDLSIEGRFTDDDYLVMSIYYETGGGGGDSFIIAFQDSATETMSYVFTGLSAGWNHVRVKRSDMTDSGSFDWSDVQGVFFNDLTEKYIDDIRTVKADPDDATDYNDTGNSWDKAEWITSDAGEWHIYEGNRDGEPQKPFSYGQIKTGTYLWYMSNKPISTTNIATGTIQAGIYPKGADGIAGLSFFLTDNSMGAWNMYSVEINSGADLVTLAKWVGGIKSTVAYIYTTALPTPFSISPNEITWVGADFRDFDTDGGRIKVFASLTEGNLMQASNLIISTQDTSLASGGSVGVVSYQSNVRFVNFTAGSPAHAEVADVALALDGPLITGRSSRLWLRNNPTSYHLEKSSDGKTFEAASRVMVDFYLSLPGLVGFWPMSSVQRSTGNAYDLSGQGRILTYNGNPTYNFTDKGTPYIDFDGTGDYLSRANETDLDIIGTESWATNPGLTLAFWVYPTTTTSANIMGKANGSSAPFLLFFEGGTNYLFRIRDSGNTTDYDVRATSSVVLNTWQFVACRFTPSTEIKIWEGADSWVNTTSIPAALLSNTDSLGIGAFGSGSDPFTGKITLPFLSANALSDEIIDNIYQRTRGLFGV